MHVCNLEPIIGGAFNTFSCIYNSQPNNDINSIVDDDLKKLIPRLYFKQDTYTSEEAKEETENLLPITVLSNHSSLKVITRDFSNLPKTIVPKTKFINNAFYIISVYTFKNPYKDYNPDKTISEFGAKIIKRYDESTSVINKELVSVIKALHTYAPKLTSYHLTTNKDTYVSILTYIKIDEKMLLEKGSIFIRNKNIVVSIKDLDDVEDHPSVSSDNPFISKQFSDSVNKNHIAFVLVDNDNKLKDKYIKILDRVVKIPKIVDHTRQDGLYAYSSINSNLYSYYLTIDEITEKRVVFNSEEEALEYTDSAKIIENKRLEFKQKELEYQQKELKMQADIAKLKSEAEELKVKAESQALEQRMEFEKKISEMKLEHSKQLNEIELKKNESGKDYIDHKQYRDIEGIKFKQDYEESLYRLKNKYEEEKYKRDTTIETLKTVATIASVATTIYLLAKKS